MRALVTGAAGFLGRNIVQRLVSEGASVIAVDVRLMPEWMAAHPQVDAREIDLTLDFDELTRMRGPLDEVWHFASWASPPRYKTRAIETLRLGGEVTDRLLGVAHAREARLLFASSSEVYGDPEVHPQHEEYRGRVSTTGPRSMYDESKRYGEAMCAAYQKAGCDARIARIFNTYGPCMDPMDGRLVPALLTAAIRGTPFEVHGGGYQTRTLCYVDDLLDGLFTLMRAPRGPTTRQPTNIGGEDELTVLQVLEAAGAACGCTIETVHVPKQDAHDPMVRKPDLSRIRGLGWSGPRVGVIDGLRRTYDWFRGVDPLQLVEKDPQVVS